MWVTIQDVIDAAEKNGLEWIKGEYLKFNDDGVPVAGCALGQIAYNLECAPIQLHNALNKATVSDFLGSAIISENDRYAGTYEDAVKGIRTLLDQHKSKKISLRKVKYYK